MKFFTKAALALLATAVLSTSVLAATEDTSAAGSEKLEAQAEAAKRQQLQAEIQSLQAEGICPDINGEDENCHTCNGQHNC